MRPSAIDRSTERETFGLFVADILVAILRISAALLPGEIDASSSSRSDTNPIERNTL